MKYLFAILLFSLQFIIAQSSFGGPTNPVMHLHNGRAHIHPLPGNWLAHRHGHGALGIALPKARNTRNYDRNSIYSGIPGLGVLSRSSQGQAKVGKKHAHNGRVHIHILPAQGYAHRHKNGALGGVVREQAGGAKTKAIDNSIYSGLKNQTQYKSKGAVTHSHNGRLHTHILPAQGYAHRHRNRAFGVAVSRKQLLPIRNPKKTRKATQLRLDKGDIRCRLGEADCNVCASNVRQQFKRAATGKTKWQTKPWYFDWPQRYNPYGLRPLDVFNGTPAYALGIPDKHVQGFVKTNSARFPFAGSHSHKRKGSIFVIGASKGRYGLATLQQTKSNHPSGVHTLGRYLVYADGGDLAFKDLNSYQQKSETRFRIGRSDFGGGLGLVRLAKDNVLVISTRPGGQSSAPRYHQFYHLQTRGGRPVKLTDINRSSSVVPKQWPSGFKYSENLSVVTECGTGDIYTIHTSGDERVVSAIKGKGYWRLSKLQIHKGKLSLKPISAFSSAQNLSSCSSRAAATVFANPQHRLEFYCHGYAKDPDGSMFNVLGPSSRNKDRFYFNSGTL